MKFVFYTPHFDENNGGVIAIFKLADLLNRHGHVAKIWHWTRIHQNEVRLINGKISTQFVIPKQIVREDIDCPYPVIQANDEDIEDSIIIYPEIIEGNPLGARRVARWLLNKPGVINGVNCFSFNDLIFHYADHFLPDGYTSEDAYRVKITDLKMNLYKDSFKGKREGIYYMIRKGHDVPHTYHPAGAIQVDGKSHLQLAELFSQAEMFISYDLHTAYSLFASMSGCDSVVVPRPGISLYEWKVGADLKDIDGIAYGYEDIPRARESRSNMMNRVLESEKLNLISMNNFINSCSKHFNSLLA